MTRRLLIPIGRPVSKCCGAALLGSSFGLTHCGLTLTHWNSMKVILFGASGMVGQGVLRECLLDPAVTQILTVGRRADAPRDPKLTQIVHRDFFDFVDI